MLTGVTVDTYTLPYGWDVEVASDDLGLFLWLPIYSLSCCVPLEPWYCVKRQWTLSTSLSASRDATGDLKA